MGFRKGTGFTNINRILQANRGSKLGQTVAGGITGQAQKVQTGIQGAQQGFEEEAQKTRLDTEEAKKKREGILGRFDAPIPQNKVQGPNLNDASTYQSQLGDRYTQFKDEMDMINRRQHPMDVGPNSANAASVAKQKTDRDALMARYGVTAPQPAAQPAFQPSNLNPVSDEEVKDFQRFRTGTYTGPAELKDVGALTSQAQQAEALGGLARSAGGRQELLRQFVGGRDYTSGQRRLDETVLSRDQGANLGAAARSVRGTLSDVEQANRLAADKAKEYRGKASQFGAETQTLIGQKKDPISAGLSGNLTKAQEIEKSRQENLKGMQDLLSGTGEGYGDLDQITRLGLALQQATDSGFLKGNDLDFLLGKNDKIGLLQRGANLGLDINQLVNERMKDISAENLSRTGIASDEDVARLNALDRLSGKTGTDLEFGEGRGKFKAGNIGFDLKSLEDYINRAEQQKAAGDAKYASDLAAEKGRYLNQALAYGQGAFGNVGDMLGNMTSSPSGLVGLGTYGAGAGLSAGLTGSMAPLGAMGSGSYAGVAGPVAIAAMLGVDTLTGKDTTAQTTQAGIDTGLNTAGAAAQGTNAAIEGLLKLNIGGKSIANTPAGQQLLKALAYTSQAENKAIQGVSDVSKDWTGSIGNLTKNGLSDLAHGNISTLAENVYGSAGVKSGVRMAENIAREIQAERVAKEAAEKASKLASSVVSGVGSAASNVGNAIGNAASSVGGAISKAFSDEDLKEDISYGPKDVQAFMDRLKPASYNYKDEIKNDPRASRDRQIGVMAQDLEKSKLGKEAVSEEPEGKIVDYKDLQPKMLASLAALNQRMKKLEGKD